MSELRVFRASGAPGISVSSADCAAMPDAAQVPDVSALVPGRTGRGVRLSALLALLDRASEPGSRDERSRWLNVVSTDPAFAVSLPIAEVASAIVVYALDGAPLPEKKGGPFRLLVPGHKDECVHVKQVASLEVSDRPGRDARPKDDAEHEKLHRKGKGP